MRHRILRRRSEHRHPGVTLPDAKRMGGKSLFLTKKCFFAIINHHLPFHANVCSFFLTTVLTCGMIDNH